MMTSTIGVDSARLNGGQTERLAARAWDQSIYVFMAVWFIVITLAGFVPDSIGLVRATRAGARPPIPPILHVHATLMGLLLLLLLAQTLLMASGRRERHERLGRAMMVLAPAIFIVWLVLVPTIYRQYWFAAHSPAASLPVQRLSSALDDIFLGQLRVGVLFPLFIILGLRTRCSNPELHKRMMILAIATVLPPALARMWWLPKPLPGLMSYDVYILFIISPMLVRDLVRRRQIPKAYLIWASAYFAVSLPAYALTGSAWWHATVPQLMQV